MTAKLAIDGGERAIKGSGRFPTWPQSSPVIEDALQRVARSGAWGSNVGTEVAEFEREFAAFQEAAHGIATVNGTIAITAALKALGVGLGDEVIVPSYTFIATASAALSVGAIPVFADVNADDHLIDVASVEALITPRTRAIICVHLSGAIADLDSLSELAKRHGVALVEDAAQAVGASYRGRRVGAIGDIGTFSFQSSKNMTAGEGGMMLTSSQELAAALYSFVNVGRVPGGGWYEHRTLGFNLRLTEFQGAILRGQLPDLLALQAHRETVAQRLHSAFGEIEGVETARVDPSSTEHGRHLFLTRVPDLGRDGLRDVALAALRAEGVEGAFSGYVALHRNAAMQDAIASICAALGRPMPPAVECPVTDLLCADTIWLDQKALLVAEEVVDEIAHAFAKVLAARKSLERLAGKGNT